MKRVIFILLMLSVHSVISDAYARSDRRLTYGVEWGYIATVQSGYRYIFFPPEGYRIDVRGNAILYHSNADMYAHVGYDFNQKWNLSLYLGYAGVHDIHNVLPMSLRMTRYFKSNKKGDRWLSFIDLGSGICLKTPVQEILTGKIGTGYRISLSADTKLDFLLSARMTYTHPQIIYDGMVISHDMVSKNNAYVSALSIGIGLTF
jgi:hypothetical protein